MHVAQQRRRVIEPTRWKRNLGLPTSRAVGHSLVNQFAYAVELHFGDYRAYVDRFVERRADSQGAHSVLQLYQENLSDALLHEQARACATNLALIEPDSIDQTLYRAVKIRIFKDNERGLAAEFE
jgi:hypothetical protein